MEHDSLYTTFREKLENRKIVPSDNAWNVLEAKLDAGNPPKKNSLFSYWVAASVAVVLLGSVYFSTPNSPDTVPVPIVNTNKENNVPREQEPYHTEPVVQKDTEKETPAIKKERKPITQKAIAHHAPEDTEEKARSFEDRKVDEVVAEIQKLQQEKAVSEAEIDALLATAREAIRSNRKVTTTTGKIDAMALLEGVEEELDQSFKERVFEALKENFFKVTTAVAERNN